MNALIAISSVIVLSIWVQDQAQRHGAGSWQRAPIIGVLN